MVKPGGAGLIGCRYQYCALKRSGYGNVCRCGNAFSPLTHLADYSMMAHCIIQRSEDKVIQEESGRSRRQTRLSVIILSTLVIIAAGVFFSQFGYNPAILHQIDLLPASDSAAPSSLPDSMEAFEPLPAGLEPLAAPEVFGAANLSDKINGKAELYLSAGFASLTSQRFRDKAASDLWIEVYVYDMGDGRNAFAVFSAQRRENAESLDLAPYAYRSSNAVFLVHGRFYLELIASEASGRIIQSMEMLAAGFIDSTPIEAVVISEQNLFPPQHLVADSITLIAADAFGFERLNQVYSAEYQLEEDTLMAYISRRSSHPEAEELAAAYGNFLLNFGGQQLEQPLPIKNARAIEILDTYEIIFSHGPYLAGVREAPSPGRASELAILLSNKLKEKTGD